MGNAADKLAEGDGAALVDVGGRGLYAECRGSGGPVVVMEAPFRTSASTVLWIVLVASAPAPAPLMPPPAPPEMATAPPNVSALIVAVDVAANSTLPPEVIVALSIQALTSLPMSLSAIETPTESEAPPP